MKEYPQVPTREEVYESVRLGYYWRRLVADPEIALIALGEAVQVLEKARLLDFLPEKKGMNGYVGADSILDTIKRAWKDAGLGLPPQQQMIHLKRYLEQKLVSSEALIKIAIGSGEKQRTFEEIINDKRGRLIKLPAFSGESFPANLRQAVRNAAMRGCQVLILTLSEAVARKLEPESKPSGVAKWITELASEYPEKVMVRILDDERFAHFSGALVYGEDLIPLYYRVAVSGLEERRTAGVFAYGDGQTSLFKLLERYFDLAWESAIPLSVYQKRFRQALRGFLRGLFLQVGARRIIFVGGILVLLAFALSRNPNSLAFQLTAVLLPLYLSIPELWRKQ
ncbi:hypothetical protein D6817_02075 [Candidatus Pacearchaeota archaeon]|nr:MAG: hypothetical protein D6817_02075 [Candidatus Pacearchaeota archaeon]